jgi:gliding motility-associated-like protein
MRNIIILISFFLTANVINGQETMYVAPGSQIQFGSSTPAGIFGYLVNEGNLSMKKSSHIFFSGKIWVNKPGSKVTDDSLKINSLNGGTVHFVTNPYGQQILESSSNANNGSFSNIIIDNYAGLILASNVSVLNNLHFQRGHLLLNKHDLEMGDDKMSGNITGYDENRFVVTGTDTTGGFIRQKSIVSNALVTFPFGPTPSIYSPAQLVNNGLKDDFFARAFNNVYQNAVSGPKVKDSTVALTWEIGKKSPAEQDVVVTLQNDMNTVEEPVYKKLRSNSFITLYGNSKWDKPNALAKGRSPGSISSSFPIQNAMMNSRKLTLGNKRLFLSKKVTTRPKSIDVINVFSPNGDNVNDTWNIKGITDYEHPVVEIYNRLGRLVFRSFGYRQQWDGTFNGAPLPVATYYYVIDLKNGASPLTGYVLLLR